MEERFAEAEEIFNEIYDIDKDYKNVQQLLREARYEPLYRNAPCPPWMMGNIAKLTICSKKSS
ncbi:MAG: hypothetical protein U5L09_02415 [Bacteroidales bacterium]|nr:hypothetical protein [Bacteroidales bacterium]